MLDLKSISKGLQDAARSVLEAKKPLHPNQQKIDVHEPEKDEITAKDFEKLRSKKKQVDEVNFADVVARQKAKHGGTLPDKYPAAKKTASNLDVGTSKASKVYSGKPQHKDIFGHDTKSQAAGATGPRASVMQKVHNKIKSFFTKEDIDVILDADEVLLTTPIMVELKESYTFGDYLVAAKAIVGEDNAVELANFAFNEQATELFVEQATRGDIESKIASHKAAGHMVSEPKYKTKDGKLHAEYVVTDKESGIRRKYIQHGTSRKVENMGTKGKKDDE